MKILNAVDLIVLNNRNQVLLAKRSEDVLEYKNTWSIPGGGCDFNEGFEEALHREIKEELGCKIKWMKYFKSYFMKLSENRYTRAVYFYGEILGKIKLNHELSECKWFNINDPNLLKLNFAFNQKNVIKDFIKFWKKKNSK